MGKPSHDIPPLRTVSRLTGLTADVIRVWEKRYGVVSPERGPRGARLYSTKDIARLRLLRRVVASGRAIGDVATLSDDALEALLSGAPAEHNGRRAVNPNLVEQAVAALERFDAPALDRYLGDSLLALGTREFIRQVADPLPEEVGQRAHPHSGRDAPMSIGAVSIPEGAF